MRLARQVAEYYSNRDGMRASKIGLDVGFVALGVGVGGFLGRVGAGDVHWWNVAGLMVVTVSFGVNVGFYMATRDLKRRKR